MAYKPVILGFNSAVPELGKFGNKNVGKFGKVKETAAEKSEYSASGFSKGGKGSGSSSDDDDIDDWFEKIKKESPCIKRSKDNRTYYQSQDGTKWYSRDSAGHGGSKVKVYRNTGKTLELEGSLDGKGRRMVGKHESGKHQTIYKNELNTIKNVK